MKRIVKLFLLVAIVGVLAGCTVCPPCETPTPGATATATPAPVVPDKPACWDNRLDDIGVTLERRNGQYELVAAWVTVDGNWDDPALLQVGAPHNIGCVMKNWPYVSGADHNAFGRAETADGSDWMAEKFGLVWPDGGDVRAPEASGWANIPIFGDGGRYDWFVFGGDKLHGVTMPGNHHWSTFAVWRLRDTVSGQAAEDAMDILERAKGE